MLADFRAFCNNADDRLRDFWNESWESAGVRVDGENKMGGIEEDQGLLQRLMEAQADVLYDPLLHDE